MREFFSRLGRPFYVEEMKKAYGMVFRSPAGAAFVWPDLTEFCYGMEPAPREGDPFVQGRAAGRRDVWLHIVEHLCATEDELFAAYRGRSIPMREEKDG